MDFINWVQESMTRVSRFFIYQVPLSLSLSVFSCSFLKLCVNLYVLFLFPWEKLGVFNPSETNSKEANILFLGQDIDCKEAVIFSLSDEVSLSLSRSLSLFQVFGL